MIRIAYALSAVAVCCAWSCAAMHSATSAGGYVVAADRSVVTGDWGKVVKTLKRKHGATVVQYNGKAGLPELLLELKNIRPKYVCFVSKPQAVGREFVKAVHETMRRIDDDPCGDAIWGIVTGYSAKDALRLAEAPLERRVRSIATSMGGPHSLDAWDSGIASDERTADNLWIKRSGGANVKQPTGGNIAKALAGAFNSIPIDYFATSGHATERNWQIIFNQDRGLLVHTKNAKLEFVEPGGKARHRLNRASLKVYVGAGNCLIGHIDRKDCMATAWMHSAGVEQFCGYTVPSWYGFMGWGVKGLYETGRYSLAEARFLENERLLWAKRRSHPASEDRGLDYDRDVFVYYGDPAQRIMFPEDRTPYRIAVDGCRVEVKFVRECTFAPLRDVRGSRPLMALLDEPPQGDAVFDRDGVEVADSVVTERYIFIPVSGDYARGAELVYRLGRKTAAHQD